MESDEVPVTNRCAIYTRKSTNLYLERDCNSIVTQKEVCAAYVKSQRLEGWLALPEGYDDGGFSGSGLQRPALCRLLCDIEEGLIDTLVVYKIDRLTRSLMDFMRLLEVFEHRGIALVSVSQAFDSSSSMGRMILNVLLTFSQFERELITERVRDSIRSRKAHGETHGSRAPIGYRRLIGKRLEIVPEEAEIVRFIFDEFLRTRKYTTVIEAVRQAGFKTVEKPMKSGKTYGGNFLEHGAVHRILRNPIYVGEVHGHDRTYKGLHEPIITRELWDAAQALRDEKRKPDPKRLKSKHLLGGLLWDDHGRHMLVEARGRQAKRPFAYVSSYARWSKVEKIVPYRVDAFLLDKLILAAVSDLLSDRSKIREALKRFVVDYAEIDRLAEKAAGAAKFLEASPADWQKDILASLLSRIEVSVISVSLMFRLAELRRFLSWRGDSKFLGRIADRASEARYELKLEVAVVTPTVWPVLQIDPADVPTPGKPDRKLIKLLARARKAQDLFYSNRGLSVRELARRLETGPLMFLRLLRLNYLAPDIVAAILDGNQPETLCAPYLLESNFPVDWSLQRKLFGFELPKAVLRSTPFGRYEPASDDRRRGHPVLDQRMTDRAQ